MDTTQEQNRCLIIFSGFNDRAVIALCRQCNAFKVPFLIVSAGEFDRIYLTKYSKNVIHQRNADNLTLELILHIFNEIKAQTNYNHFVIAPSTEYLNRFFLKERIALEKINVQIPLVNEELYSKVSDKSSFVRLCKDNGLRVPYETTDYLELEFPFVIKPNTYFAKNGEVQTKPIIVYNESVLNSIKGEYLFDDFFFQEFVPGKCLYLLFYISTSKELTVAVSQENLIQQANGGSMVAARVLNSNYYAITKKYLDLFELIGFTGLVMVELKMHNGEFFMIEANPRMWGPSQLFVDAGFPIFRNFLIDNGFEVSDFEIPFNPNAIYSWFGGLVANSTKGGTSVYYDYSSTQFMDEISLWMESDVYNRKDSRDLFNFEISPHSLNESN
ncbi:MAG: ATP-grasp domain-containing protein [Lunatimonas sp.]|uniref:ATP-grasp domain-containing protein n=1 Tax=Lunatimonas sp. TaxID=2060141 RepID=UPI00263B4A30|nr:ATP-grasp domain-containing protein [Lunatimonas sp.]MCC5937200.1 ATP-grasp domain-containing protein [Lunatimonas sp.]